jgi:L-iditol 2-dehydrogenase
MVLGGYADFILIGAHVVARNAFHKPATLGFEEAALLEPMSCVVHALEMARPEKHETVLIIGAGAFGVLQVMALKARGVREVVVAGRGEQRLRWAAEMGADRVIDVNIADPEAAVASLNGGYGPDLLSVDTRRMHYDNLTLLAPFHFRPRDVRKAFDDLSGNKLGAGRIINARRPLSELAEVFTLLEQSAVLKCAVIP